MAVSGVACMNDIRSGISNANDLLYAKKYVEAERLYRKLLKRLDGDKNLDEAEDAQRLLVLDRLGQVNALYLRDYTQAIADYQALARRYPKTEQALAAEATMADLYHHRIGDLPAAIGEYKRLVTEFPDRLEARHAQLEIVVAYFQQKNYDQARSEGATLLKRWPDTPEAAQARFEMADSYFLQKRYQDAISTYEKLLQSKPEPELRGLVLFELGNSYQEMGDSEKALSYYYACLPDHPNPTLVQRKIERMRTRLHHTQPVASILNGKNIDSHVAAVRPPTSHGEHYHGPPPSLDGATARPAGSKKAP